MINIEKIKHREIDYQKLFFFTKEEWQEILSQEEFLGVKINPTLINILNKRYFPISLQYTELTLVGAIENPSGRTCFMAYLLVNIDGYYQRIELRTIICSKCKKKILLGSPFVSDIYFGVPSQINVQKLMQKAKKFDLKPCPECGKKTAIWVEYDTV